MSMQLSSSPKGYSAFSTLSPIQQQIFQSQAGRGQITNSPLYQSGASYLQNLLSGDSSAFENFEAPYKRQFSEEIVPGLAERFSGLGAQRSSAFRNALAEAGSSLSERLASLRSGLQMQALPQALGYAQAPISNLQNLLGTQTQGLVQNDMPFWQQLLIGLSGGVSQGLGQAGGMYAGSKLSSLF